MKKVKTAIFPVGGLGTRFLPATKSMPKEMLPIASKPIIQYAFEEARRSGIEKFIFITGRNKDAISNHFDHSFELESQLSSNNKASELDKVTSWLPEAGNIIFIRQQHPLGLGHAIWCARNFIAKDEPFLVSLADELIMEEDSGKTFLSKMIDFYYQKGSSSNIIAVDQIDNKDSDKYGIISFDDSNQILDMHEKPDPQDALSDLAITGRYILQPKIFDYLAKTKKGKGGEIQLTDAMKEMIKEVPFYFAKIDRKRFDCGNVLGYIEANIAYALNNEEIKADVKEIIIRNLALNPTFN